MAGALLYKRRVNKPSQLRPLAQSFSKHLGLGIVVTLSGELGSGKTSFVRAICREFGVANEEIKSPSFTLVNEYYCPRFPVYHIDLYRLSGVEEIAGLGLDDCLGPENLCFIEWPGIAGKGLEARQLVIFEVEILFTERENERLLSIRRLETEAENTNSDSAQI